MRSLQKDGKIEEWCNLVARQTLNLSVWVQIPVPQPIKGDNMIKIVYVLGPFRKDPAKYTPRFEEASRKLWQAGFFAFNPIANCDFMHGEFSEDEFSRRCTEFLKKLNFDAAFRLEEWEDSSGAKGEIKVAREKGIPIFDSVDEICKWRAEIEKYEVRL